MASDVEAWTDGGMAGGNPGYGGWGVYMRSGTGGGMREKRLCGGVAQETTNQRMEILATIEALRAIRPGRTIRLYVDSAYVVNCMRRRWFERWRENGWRNSSGEAVANDDLWRTLLALVETRHGGRVTFLKVKGHAACEENNEADRLAGEAARAALAQANAQASERRSECERV